MPEPALPAILAAALSSSAAWQGAAPDLAAAAARIVPGLLLNAVLAAGALAARSVNLGGAVAGVALGTAIYAGLGWRGFLLLAAFFLIGSAATRVGFGAKVAAGIAQGGGGRRGAGNALANAGVAAACALGAAVAADPAPWVLGFAGSLAAAAADTAGSELGPLLSRRTVLITSLRPVPPGTDGGVSAGGTLAGAGAALAVAGIGAAAGLLPLPAAVAVAAAGVAGSACDSLLGATLERRGALGNETVNLLATLAGAAAAAALGAVPGL